MSINSSSAQRLSNDSSIALSKIVQAGLIAIVAAVAANLIVRALVLAFVDLPGDFPPLQPGPIALFTAIGVGLGAIVFAVVSRFARRPVRTFNIIAVIALIVSIIPNLALMANPAAAPMPGGTALGFGVLIIFHLVAAAISVPLITMPARR